jgi:hypothetical protein
MRMTQQQVETQEAQVAAAKGPTLRERRAAARRFLDTPAARRIVGGEELPTSPSREGRPKAEAAALSVPDLSEKEQHETFQQWCNLHELEAITAPMFRRSFLPKGFPDFMVCGKGKCCWIEFKVADNQTTAEQDACQIRLVKRGIPGVIAYTVGRAIAFAKEQFNL